MRQPDCSIWGNYARKGNSPTVGARLSFIYLAQAAFGPPWAGSPSDFSNQQPGEGKGMGFEDGYIGERNTGHDNGQGSGFLDDVKGLWGKARDKVQESGVIDKAKDAVKNVDVKGLAEQVGKHVQNGDLNSIAGVAGTMMFPQAAILKFGAGEAGELLGKKQAKALLEHPDQLADKMKANFDPLDDNKNGFIADNELKNAGSGLNFLSDNRSLIPILRSGYTTFAGLDGKDADKGISRADVEVFQRLYKGDALKAAIDEDVSSSRLKWGIGGGLAGGAGAFLSTLAVKASTASCAGRIALGAVVGLVALGGLGGHLRRSSDESYYAKKRAEMDSLLESMKSSF